jgi:hypothetical protein
MRAMRALGGGGGSGGLRQMPTRGRGGVWARPERCGRLVDGHQRRLAVLVVCSRLPRLLELCDATTHITSLLRLHPNDRWHTEWRERYSAPSARV